MTVEQRTAFRIDEQAVVYCQPLVADADTSRAPESWFSQGAVSTLTSAFDELDQHYRECHARLARIEPVAAEACEWLNGKIDALHAAVSDLVADPEFDDRPPQKISLAAAGVGFVWSDTMNVDSTLVIRLLLLPGREAITSYARVRQCRRDNNVWWIGVEFENLSADQERRLSRHLLKRQIDNKNKEL